jgi:transcriptional regulator with XRE-family HTH domain
VGDSYGPLVDRLSDVIAANARAERARLRLRQEDVARPMGISISSYSDIESGKRPIQVDEIVALAAALGVGWRVLLHGLDEDSARTLGL